MTHDTIGLKKKRFDVENRPKQFYYQANWQQACASLKASIVTYLVFGCFLNFVQLALPLFSMQIFDRVLPTGHLPTLYVLALMIVFANVAATAVDSSRSLIMARSARRLASVVADTYPAPRMSPIADTDINKDLDFLRAFISGPVIGNLLDIPWTLIYTAILSAVSLWLGLFTATSVVIYVCATELVRHLTSQDQVDYRDSESKLDYAFQCLDNQRSTLTGLGILPAAIDRINGIRTELLEVHSRYYSRMAWAGASTRALRNLLQIGMLTVSATLTVQHTINAGAIVASTMLFARALSPFERIAQQVSSLRTAAGCWTRAKTNMSSLSVPSAKMQMPSIEGRICLNQVSVQGDAGRNPRLANVSFTAAPGELHMVLGDEGAGKSTFAELLCGVVLPSGGTLHLDGMSLSNFDERQLSRQIGYLPQEITFRGGSVSDIIGRETDVDHEAVALAATLAGIDTFVRGLPFGYQTELQGQARQLSAGQAKRLAFARAIYRFPQLLILDEPLNGLDAAGESRVVSAIQLFKKKGRTIIVVSRSSMFLHLADKAWVLKEGVIQYALDGAEMRSQSTPKGVAV